MAWLISAFESERRFYDEVVTMLPVPLATVGKDGSILSANLAFLAAFPISREDLERQPLDVIFKDIPWRRALKPREAGSLATENDKILFTPVPRWDCGETEWTVVLNGASGAYRPARAAGSPLREDVSMLLGATGHMEAMTAQLNEFSRTARSVNRRTPCANCFRRAVIKSFPG